MVKSPLWRKTGFSVYLSCHPMRETVAQHSSILNYLRTEFSFCEAFVLSLSLSVSAEVLMGAVQFTGHESVYMKKILMVVSVTSRALNKRTYRPVLGGPAGCLQGVLVPRLWAASHTSLWVYVPTPRIEGDHQLGKHRHRNPHKRVIAITFWYMIQ